MCATCGESFQTPVLAKFSVGGNVQEYYACPRCLTQVRELNGKKKENGKTSTLNGIAAKRVKKLDSVVCKHHFGYLKNRQKNDPIPDECLVCHRMIECMLR